MTIEAPLHRKAEKLARKWSRRDYGTESLWDMYLVDAYREVSGVNELKPEPEESEE